MSSAEEEYLRIQFQRVNAKYNRLWTQLGSITIFFVTTFFALILAFANALQHDQYLMPAISFILINLLATLFSIGAWLTWREMRAIWPDISSTLSYFRAKMMNKKGTR